MAKFQNNIENSQQNLKIFKNNCVKLQSNLIQQYLNNVILLKFENFENFIAKLQTIIENFIAKIQKIIENFKQKFNKY